MAQQVFLLGAHRRQLVIRQGFQQRCLPSPTLAFAIQAQQAFRVEVQTLRRGIVAQHCGAASHRPGAVADEHGIFADVDRPSRHRQ